MQNMRLECENSVNNRSQECEKLKVAHCCAHQRKRYL